MAKFDLMTLGVPMVEFTRSELDVPLSKPGSFYGPAPAGDPGIALNACVRLGYRGCYVGVLGGDAFADCFLEQMRRSGIDVSHLRTDARLNTGLSMLTKFSDGSRKFVFTVPNSAAAAIGPRDLDRELLLQVRWVHLSGFALSISASAAELHRELIGAVGDDVRVSFDPNFRPEVITKEEYLSRSRCVLERCDYFLPSRGEAALFAGRAQSEEDFCRELSKAGKEVALKDGSRGAYAFSAGRERFFPAFRVTETDATGAGDTFDGALIAATLDGKGLFEAAAYATAAGALAVTRRGLMEIAPSRAEIEGLLAAGGAEEAAR